MHLRREHLRLQTRMLAGGNPVINKDKSGIQLGGFHDDRRSQTPLSPLGLCFAQ